MDDPVVLPELLTIGDLGALQERLLGVLKARRVIDLDGRPVTAIDTAGLQRLGQDVEDRKPRIQRGKIISFLFGVISLNKVRLCKLKSWAQKGI